MRSPFSVEVSPDWEALVRCIRRQGTPRRVHFAELFLDGEIQTAICERFHLLDSLDTADPNFARQLAGQIAIQRFLGYPPAGGLPAESRAWAFRRTAS